MLLAFSFILGVIVGSFANVFVLRYGTGRSLGGRSSCAVCGARLRWFELVPVVSWLIQRGKCRSCESKISPQYLFVELIFGTVFMLCTLATFNFELSTFNSIPSFRLPAEALAKAGPYVLVELVYLWIASFLLISIAVYDIRHLIIPDGMVVALSIVALVWSVSANFQLSTFNFQLDYVLVSLRPLFSGLIVALPFFVLWLVSRGRWMGLGDAKLALAVGIMLGIVGGLSAMVFAVWIGAVVSLAIIGISRLVARTSGLTMKSEIPFGPFIVVGAFVVFFWQVTLLDVISAF